MKNTKYICVTFQKIYTSVFRLLTMVAFNRNEVSREKPGNYDLGQGLQKWTKQNLWKTAFKKLEMRWSALADHITSVF